MNNAGFSVGKSFMDTTIDDLDGQLNIFVRAPFTTTKQAMPSLIENKGVHFLHVGFLLLYFIWAKWSLNMHLGQMGRLLRRKPWFYYICQKGNWDSLTKGNISVMCMNVQNPNSKLTNLHLCWPITGKAFNQREQYQQTHRETKTCK